jgi:hypothetical protein
VQTWDPRPTRATEQDCGCRVGGEKRPEVGGARPGGGASRAHLSPSLSQDRLTGGLLLTLTHVKFRASPGRSADVLATIVRLVGGT